jgi:hypothetical protein
MPFVCAALARHICHCRKFKDPYDVERAFKRAMPIPASEEALMNLKVDLDAEFEVMDAHLCLSEG